MLPKPNMRRVMLQFTCVTLRYVTVTLRVMVDHNQQSHILTVEVREFLHAWPLIMVVHR